MAVRAAAWILLLAALGAAEPDKSLREVVRAWPKLDRAGKLEALTRLGARPSAALLARCAEWISDPDPIVAGQVARLVGLHAGDRRLRGRAAALLERHIRAHLERIEKRAEEEFRALVKKYGDRVPPGDRMEAGAGWRDPYDEGRRPLPPEIRAERAHMKELLEALAPLRTPALAAGALEIFRRHPDPEVLVRTIRLFARWKAWEALPAMADLLRIQEHGRELGGGDVIGKERYAALRLKWDVFKDRIWWSRPEYVPRVQRPILEAVRVITGADLRSSAELDAWLLEHESELRKHGVRLEAAFRARARSTRRNG